MGPLKSALARNELTWVLGLGQFCLPKFIEIIGFEKGYHAVWLDQEHAGITVEQMENACRAARGVGLDAFVRFAPTDYATVMRPMEAGACGIMAAQVRNAQQAAEIVNWSKFYPQGLRGVNSSGIDGRFGTVSMKDYVAEANANSFVAIQIEHKDAVDDVDAIAAVPNTDILFIGPADLTQSMGIIAQWDHPDLWKAIEKVAKAAARNKIHWAILPTSPPMAKRCLDLGCKMLSIGIDTWVVQRGVRSFKQEYGIA